MRIDRCGRIALLILMICALLSVSVSSWAEGQTSEMNRISGSVSTSMTNEEMFEAYLHRQVSGTMLRGINPGRLTGLSREIYNWLQPMVRSVANGDVSSTEFSAPSGWAGFDIAWTAKDLGVDAIFDGGSLTDAAAEAFGEKLGQELDKAVNTLIVNEPYHLYWFDVTEGYEVGFYNTFTQVGSEDAMALDTLDLSLYVAKEYSAADAVKTFATNTALITSAKAAAARAQEIVAEAAGKSDLEKLEYYKDAICDRVSYNTAAAADETMPYGNPWQLIWVFDGDDSTNVVCEGYSKAFQFLCDLTEFEEGTSCFTVTGIMGGGTGAGGHMWNVVQMPDSQYYLVDVTNSDEGSIGSSGELFLNGWTSDDPTTYMSGESNVGYVYTANGKPVVYIYDVQAMDTFTRDELTMAQAAYAEPEWNTLEAVKWVILENGTLVICGNGPMPDFDSETAPWFSEPGTIETVVIQDGVTRIGAYAFDGLSSAVNISLPESVSEIGAAAFRGCGISSITIPEGVTVLEGGILQQCESLKTVTLPSTLTSVQMYAFYKSERLTDVYFAGSMEAWRAISVADNNDPLESADIHCTDGDIAIPTSGSTDEFSWNLQDGDLTIDGEYFCTYQLPEAMRSRVRRVFISKDILDIGFNSHDLPNVTDIIVDENNSSYTSVDGVLFDKDQKKLVWYPSTRTGSYTVPSGVEEMGFDAFNGSQLSTLILPEGLKKLGCQAIYNCRNLTDVIIPASVTFIDGPSTNFRYCTNMQNIYVADGNTVYEDRNGILYEKATDMLFAYPSGRTESEITVSGKIIGAAFLDNYSISSVTFADGVEKILDNAFSGCYIDTVILPVTLRSIGKNAFGNSLNSVTYAGTLEQWAAVMIAPGNERLIANVQCADGTSDSHDYAGELGEGITYLMTGDTITVSGAGEWTESYAFSRTAQIVHVVLENGVTEIGQGAFIGCSGLQTMEIPASLTHIRYYALEGCTSLTEITYGGTKAQWAAITVDEWGNDVLKTAVIHCTDGDYDGNETPEEGPVLTISYEVDGQTIQPGSSFALGQTLTVNWEVSGLRQVEGGYYWNISLYGDATLHDDNKVHYDKYDYEGTGYGSAESGSMSGSFTFTPHEGDRLSITKKLSNYGIPSDEIPVWENDVFALTGSTTEPIQANVELSQNAETLTVTANVTSNSTGYGYATWYYDVKDDAHVISSSRIPNGNAMVECVIPMRVEKHVICSISLNDFSKGLELSKDYTIELEGFEPLPENACGLNLTWRFENETLILEGTGPMLNYMDSRTPWKAYNSQIKSIQLPEGLTHIGDYAFEFTAVTDVIIPDSVESIGFYAFLGNHSLKTVFISKGVQSLDDEPFYMSDHLTTFTVDSENPNFKSANGIVFTKDGKELVMIPEGAESLVFPNGLTSIPYSSSFNEGHAKSITIPVSVTEISADFIWYGNLYGDLKDIYYLGTRKQFSEIKRINWEGENAPMLPVGSMLTLHCAPTPAEKTLVLPSGTRTIEDQAFYGIKAEEVVIPSGATSIGSEAFAGNADLIIARIPSSVTQIADNAFTGCSPYLLIIGESGSVAETYATSHNLSFEKAN